MNNYILIIYKNDSYFSDQHKFITHDFKANNKLQILKEIGSFIKSSNIDTIVIVKYKVLDEELNEVNI